MITLGFILMLATVLVAHFQGRNLLAWILVGFVFSPIISLLVLLVLGKPAA